MLLKMTILKEFPFIPLSKFIRVNRFDKQNFIQAQIGLDIYNHDSNKCN
jgi:hypothetical protein